MLTSSPVVIGEGRGAPSGLPIRTLTSINISASFLYRSGLSRTLPLLTLLIFHVRSCTALISVTAQSVELLLGCMKRSQRTQHLGRCLQVKPPPCISISVFPFHTPGVSITRSFTAPLGGRRQRGAASVLTCRRGGGGGGYATEMMSLQVKARRK